MPRLSQAAIAARSYSNSCTGPCVPLLTTQFGAGQGYNQTYRAPTIAALSVADLTLEGEARPDNFHKER